MQIQTGADKSDINRLLTALNHQEPDRLPHIELWVTSQAVYEHILERKLDYIIGDAAEGGQSITPEDDVEFAQRLGQDAVLCNFNWRPNNVFQLAEDGTRHYVDGTIKSMADLGRPGQPARFGRTTASFRALFDSRSRNWRGNYHESDFVF